VGLGLPGGPGWVEAGNVGFNLYMAQETLRAAADFRSAYLESWMTPAWRFDPEHLRPAPRAVLLPDLGGPAVGAASIAGLRPGTGVTNTLLARVAVQNLVTATARVEIDSFADCGYAGTIARELDPRQAEWLPSEALPGTLFGANAARLRVLAGEVAVLTELVRPEQQTTAAYGPDFSSGWLGGRVAEELPAPTITVTPTLVTIVLPGDLPDPPFVRVQTLHVDRACQLLTVSSDRPWLEGEVGPGNIPGGVTVLVDPDKMGLGRRHVGHLLLAADPATAPGLPQTVTVVVVREDQPEPVYLPWSERSRP
jgi:hypothetical protein